MCPYFYYSAGLFQSFFKCNRTSRTFPLRRSDYILPKQKIPPFTGVSYFQITLVFASFKLVRACESLIVKCVRRGGGFWRQTADSNIFLRHISSIRQVAKETVTTNLQFAQTSKTNLHGKNSQNKYAICSKIN